MADPPAPTAGHLAFPAVARLELDQLLDQLIERAGEVKSTQGRLRGLLAATQNVAGGLELDDLLRRVVDSARSLIGARHGALGVIQGRRLTSFVHAGMTPEQVRAIGDLPAGRGLLGHLVDHPEPLRLDHLGSHPAAHGFPPDHPAMDSFLGVPVRVGDAVYGNLYLTDKVDAGGAPAAFSAEDQELLVALAAAAGVAIENALLLARSRRRERWQAAMTRLANHFLAGTDPDVDEAWSALLDLAQDVAGADGAALVSEDPTDPATAVVLRATGILAGWQGGRPPSAGSVTTAALRASAAIVVPDTRVDPRTSNVIHTAPAVRSAVAAPLSEVPDEPRTVLVLTRTGEAEPFGQAEGELVGEFAVQAGTALTLARSRRDADAIRRLDDRERLVHEVNDQLLRRVSRVALDLTGLASHAPVGMRDALLAQVRALDGVVREVRDTALSRES